MSSSEDNGSDGHNAKCAHVHATANLGRSLRCVHERIRPRPIFVWRFCNARLDYRLPNLNEIISEGLESPGKYISHSDNNAKASRICLFVHLVDVLHRQPLHSVTLPGFRSRLDVSWLQFRSGTF